MPGNQKFGGGETLQDRDRILGSNIAKKEENSFEKKKDHPCDGCPDKEDFGNTAGMSNCPCDKMG